MTEAAVKHIGFSPLHFGAIRLKGRQGHMTVFFREGESQESGKTVLQGYPYYAVFC